MLLQYHFHRPSEHLISGKSFPMEVHFVHRNASGTLAVVGVLMTEGKANAAFSKIVATMPAHEGPAVKVEGAIDPNVLLPKDRAYYRHSDAALQRGVQLATAARADPSGQGRYRRLRRAISDERAAGAEGQLAVRAAVVMRIALKSNAPARRRSCQRCFAIHRPRRTSRSAGLSLGRAAPDTAC